MIFGYLDWLKGAQHDPKSWLQDAAKNSVDLCRADSSSV
jgi:hypothetical protein